jgi:hypothetical protein
VTDDAGDAPDRAEDWHERLGWTFGLVADDAGERLAAVRHHILASGLVHDAWAWFNDLCQMTRLLGPDGQDRELAFARAREVVSAAGGRVLPDAIWNKLRDGRPDLAISSVRRCGPCWARSRSSERSSSVWYSSQVSWPSLLQPLIAGWVVTAFQPWCQMPRVPSIE